MDASSLVSRRVASAPVDWFNTRRLLEPIGYVPPAAFEAAYYQQAEAVVVN
jgi:transposase InsO family protein